MGKDGRRVAAVEVMINTPHIRSSSRRATSRDQGSDHATAARRASRASTCRCATLYKQGRIGLEEALTNADSRTNLEAKINFG